MLTTNPHATGAMPRAQHLPPSNVVEHSGADIFASRAKVLVNPVNTVGIMGAGLAKQFATRFPQALHAYRRACAHRLVRPGTCLYWRNPDRHAQDVLMFATKDHWRDPSLLEYIESGLPRLVDQLNRHDAPSVAIPALGCGLGGLLWQDVRPLLHSAALELPRTELHLFGPGA